MKKVMVRMNVPGGVLSPGELRRVVNAAHYFDVQNIHIGSRQNIYLYLPEKYVDDFKKRINGAQYEFEIGEFTYQNIMTSFVTIDLAKSSQWLTEGVYLEILSSFTYRPKLKINIVDPKQALVPLFSGHLNFIASTYDNYWHLYIKFPGKDKAEQWPVLVDSSEVPAISEAIESAIFSQAKINLIQLEVFIYNLKTWSFRMNDKPLTLKPNRLMNDEGFHSMGERLWLGIYDSNNSFSIPFIENLCILCAQTNIGSISITPWNTMVIKNIEEKHVSLWEGLLGSHNVNTGHSKLELTWLVSEADKKGQEIKQYILRAFERKGLRMEGLTLGISAKGEELNCSILIKQRYLFRLFGLPLFSSYEVKFRRGFDPNATELISFADGLKKRNLAQVLSYLSSLYYEELKVQNALDPSLKSKLDLPKEEPKEKKFKEVFQCKECLTVYDPHYGDESVGIKPNTEFKNLPEEYKCSLCEASKEFFVPVNMEELYVSSK
jgi:rubredoxin